MIRKIGALILALAVVLCATGCAQMFGLQESTKSTTGPSGGGDVTGPTDVSDLFSDGDLDASYGEYVTVTLSDGGNKADGIGVSLGKTQVNIDKGGTYLFTGTLSRGQIKVAAGADAKVRIIFKNASVSNSSGAALFIQSASKVTVTLAEGTDNRLCAIGDFSQNSAEGVDAAVFSKADLTINGSGSLTVSSKNGHGIVSKDDLKVADGTYSVTASGQGLSGKDLLAIGGGTFTIQSGTDGLQSQNAEDASRGIIHVGAGKLDITAGSDGMDATNSVHIAGGQITMSAGDDGVHADRDLQISGGTLQISKCYEGLEATKVTISGGDIALVSSDDGINAAGGNDGSASGGPEGRDPFAVDPNAGVTISGGKLRMNVGGDGLDSNGHLTITGGEVYVDGPTRNDNGAIDCGGEAKITGGIVIAVGASGMAQSFSANSTQGVIAVNVSGQSAGSLVQIADSGGKVLASFEAAKAFQHVVISAPGMQVGQSYVLTAGDSQQTIKLETTVYGGGGMGPGGMPPGGGREPGPRPR